MNIHKRVCSSYYDSKAIINHTSSMFFLGYSVSIQNVIEAVNTCIYEEKICFISLLERF